MSESETDILKAKLNTETGKLYWKELRTHFARGIVLCVNANVDLVHVAMLLAQDKKEKIEQLLAEGSLNKMADEQAKALKDDDVFWAVVVAPWVVVQVVPR